MKCYYHPALDAVSTCIDCGKGLCNDCTKAFQWPICNECNTIRLKNEKNLIISKYVFSILGLIVGIILGVSSQFPLLSILAMAYIFAGIPWGQKVVNFITPKVFLFLPFVGWVFYFTIKFSMSLAVGVVAMPIGLFSLIIQSFNANKKGRDIAKNMAIL